MSPRSNRPSSRAKKHWDARYLSGGNLGREPAPLLVRALHGVPLGQALELACGAGRNAIYLATRGWQVTAVDVSKVAIDILRKRAEEAGVQVDGRVADLEAGELTIKRAAYDLICDFYYLQRDLFPEIRRGLRSGGQFVASIHMHDEDPDVSPMNPAYLLDPGELRRFFKGWEIVYYREGKPDDSDHNRNSADIVARKRSKPLTRR